MPSDPYANARAVVLAGALSVAPVTSTPLASRQRAPIIIEADRSGLPLILTDTQIIWRISSPRFAAKVVVPMCSDPHHHPHRR